MCKWTKVSKVMIISGIFTAILNYYRIGTLHLPPDACAVMVKEELDFWGIADIEIDNCFWVRYHMQWDSKEALERFCTK